jgi:hypothetical protein
MTTPTGRGFSQRNERDVRLIEAPCSPPEADGECARPVEFPEGNPIPQGELVQFKKFCIPVKQNILLKKTGQTGFFALAFSNTMGLGPSSPWCITRQSYKKDLGERMNPQ